MTDNIDQKPIKKRVSFSVGGDDLENNAYNISNLTEGLSSILSKSVQPQITRSDLVKKYDKSKLAFSTRDFYRSANGIETKGHKRITDFEQKELAQLDPYVSAIISKRTAQATIVSRPSESKFDKGCRIAELDPLKQDDFDDLEQYKAHQKTRKLQMHAILKWIQTCGNNDKELLDSVFSGMDPTWKKCTFPEFVAAQVRNLLTFGRCASQIFRERDTGLPVLFRPLAVETIFLGDPSQDLHLGLRDEVSPDSERDAEALNQLHEDQKPQYYVQRIEGQNVNTWSEDDLKMWYFQKQAYYDLNGYPLSPIELAIYMVFIHQQTLGYLRNQFVKGLATKGIISIENIGDASSDLGPEDMDQIRRDFHNYLLRNDNSAATPIFSGPFKVNFVPLSVAPQDMGFLQLEEHIVRALCSAFQISPQEMGYGNLSIGQGGLTQANKQEEIIRGEETGLRMLLDIVFDGVNEIIYENFPEAKELYRLTYVGVGEDTRDSAIQRQISEIQTTATLSSLWSDSEKNNPVPYGGDVPLNATWHQNVARYMKYGVMMEMFFGEEGAASKPEYDFIIDPNLNQAYQQLKVTPIKQQQEQAKLQLEQAEVQTQQIAQQMQMAEQQAQQGSQQQEAPQEQAQGQAPQESSQESGEDVEKSLADEYNERRKLKKSLGYYLGEWLEFNSRPL